MDDRCDDAGQDGHGIRERGLCERAGKAGVLQTNLKRQRADLLFVEAEHLGGDVAREQAEHMVQRNGEHGNEHDSDAVGCELVSVWADAQTLHEDDAGGGSLDKEIFKAVYAVAERGVYGDTEEDRQQDDEHDADEHVPEVDVNPLTGEHEREGRGEHRRKQCSAHGDGDGERHVTLCKERHDV